MVHFTPTTLSATISSHWDFSTSYLTVMGDEQPIICLLQLHFQNSGPSFSVFSSHAVKFFFFLHPCLSVKHIVTNWPTLDESCLAEPSVHVRGQVGGQEELFVWSEKVWLPSHSAYYRWRGLLGVVLQVPAASVWSVPNAVSSPLQPTAPFSSLSLSLSRAHRKERV